MDTQALVRISTLWWEARDRNWPGSNLRPEIKGIINDVRTSTFIIDEAEICHIKINYNISNLGMDSIGVTTQLHFDKLFKRDVD